MNRHAKCEKCGKTLGRRRELWLPGPRNPLWRTNGDWWKLCHPCYVSYSALKALADDGSGLLTFEFGPDMP